MRRFLILSVVAVLGSMIMVVGAGADNGPHGNYSATTDKCAACHRAHTAAGDMLLVKPATEADKSEFCYSCHSGGAGAYTDVKNGVFVNNTSVPVSHNDTELWWEPGNIGLMGGGFEQVKMNPNMQGGLAGSVMMPVTSKHMVTGGSNTVWGYGAITTTANAGMTGVTLTCTNCHNPHGNAGEGGIATYRILKGKGSSNTALFKTTTTSVSSNYDVYDEAYPRWYFLDYWYAPDGNYFKAHSYDSFDGSMPYARLTEWCTQCHTRYKAPLGAGSGHTDSGDAIYHFRHPTNLDTRFDCSSCHTPMLGLTATNSPACITCHVAHGTGVREATYGSPVEWPDQTTTPVGSERSALLRLDGRGVCTRCHNK